MGTPQSQYHDIHITRNIPFLAGKAWQFVNVIDGVETVIDLTNYTAQIIARKDYSEEIIFDWNTTNGKLGILNTQLLFNIDSADTAIIDAGIYNYNLKLTSTNGGNDFEGCHGISCIADNTIQI